MTDTESLIGPLPEMPKTPVAPTPWEVDPDDDLSVLDASGYHAGEFASNEVAALVVKLVNAAAAGRAGIERKVDHYVDDAGDNWWELLPGLLTEGRTRDQAVGYRSRGIGHYIDWSLERVAGEFGAATPVYE